MNPVIIGIKQGTMLGPGSTPVAILQVTWTVGNFGPFTTQSTWQDLNNGKLMEDLRLKAAQLSALPTPPQA